MSHIPFQLRYDYTGTFVHESAVRSGGRLTRRPNEACHFNQRTWSTPRQTRSTTTQSVPLYSFLSRSRDEVPKQERHREWPAGKGRIGREQFPQDAKKFIYSRETSGTKLHAELLPTIEIGAASGRASKISLPFVSSVSLVRASRSIFFYPLSLLHYGGEGGDERVHGNRQN